MYARIRQFAAQVTKIRFAGLIILGIAAFMAGGVFDVFYNVSWNYDAIDYMWSSMLLHSFDLDNHEAQYGAAVLTFYTLIVMAAFVTYACWKSKSNWKIRAGFAAVMGVPIVWTFTVAVLGRMQGYQGGWYENFWYVTLSPLVYTGTVYVAVRLFWSLTADSAPVEPTSPTDTAIPWTTIIARKLAAMRKGETADATPTDGPQCLAAAG